MWTKAVNEFVASEDVVESLKETYALTRDFQMFRRIMVGLLRALDWCLGLTDKPNRLAWPWSSIPCLRFLQSRNWTRPQRPNGAHPDFPHWTVSVSPPLVPLTQALTAFSTLHSPALSRGVPADCVRTRVHLGARHVHLRDAARRVQDASAHVPVRACTGRGGRCRDGAL